jgi:hypothetical protein
LDTAWSAVTRLEAVAIVRDRGEVIAPFVGTLLMSFTEA